MRFADSIMSELLAEAKLRAADRAFALELFYGVLRNLTLLDSWIGQLRTTRISVDLRAILRLGLYQILILETSPHAAVYETVALASKKHRPLINGVLRSALRRKDELCEQAKAQPLHVRTSHPEFLVRRWQNNFGSQSAETLCCWNNRPPPIYGRINQLRIGRDAFLQKHRESRALPNDPNFVEFDSLPAEALDRGDCYIQDPSTALASRLVDPQPGERILDACAAPGGKTGHLAELMRNQGVIAACDREIDRLRLLEKNLVRLGVENARVIQHDWASMRTPFEIVSLAPFDRILIDTPCSNTGVMRRRVDVRWRLRPDDFVRMQRRQIAIVRAIVSLLRPGGVFVYSTCSLEHEENEGVVRDVLANASTLRLEKQKHLFPFRDNFDGAFGAKFIQNV
jgi:16S rRNA (cytosine967-C5)-methyltransferase